MFELSGAELEAARRELRRLEARGNRVNPYFAGRRVAVGRRGMAASAHPLASLAAVDLLREGGNAVDAAVAAAAVLAVVEPAMTGPGGDVFAQYFDAASGVIYGLNGSGRSPAGLPFEHFERRARADAADRGWEVVTVPGAVDAWWTMHERFGRLAFERLLEPAAALAEDGYAVTEIVAETWRDHGPRLGHDAYARQFYLLDGRPPRCGEVFRNPAMAASLRTIGREGRDGFYEGSIATEIVAYARETGGYFELADFASHHSEWVTPISIPYRQYRVHQIPPNGQGLGVLIMLNMLKDDDLAHLGLNTPEYLHLLIESKKLAYADIHHYVADPASADVPLDGLLSESYARLRRRRIDPAQAAASVAPGVPAGSDTTYLTTVDAHGNAVSLINSLYHAFGSGIVGGKTGILLQNRGAGFSLQPEHPNGYAAGKRPFHTIIPGMVTRDGRLYMSYGLMGGPMQPQGHVQFLLAHLEHGLGIQEAADLPRWQHTQGRQVLVEHGIDAATVRALCDRGHEPIPADHRAFGGAQAIRIDPDTGAYFGASDPRKDGFALGL